MAHAAIPKGPLTEELFNALVEDWPNSPACPCCGGKLMAGKLLAYAFRNMAKKKCEISSIYPLLGMIEGFNAEGTLLAQHGWFLNFLVARVYDYLAKQLAEFGERPGDNDRIMVRWLITRQPELAWQLFARAHRHDDIGWTCRWMLGSMRQRIPQLDWQLGYAGRSAARRFPGGVKT